MKKSNLVKSVIFTFLISILIASQQAGAWEKEASTHHKIESGVISTIGGCGLGGTVGGFAGAFVGLSASHMDLIGGAAADKILKITPILGCGIGAALALSSVTTAAPSHVSNLAGVKKLPKLAIPSKADLAASATDAQ